MPTNLPPEYFRIERRFREAETVEEKIELLEEMISVVPKHKGTDHLRADLRRKLSKLKEEAQTHKGAAKRDSAFHIPKAGAGQAILVGTTNVGKSSLLAALTGANVEISAVPYTTWEPAVGMMTFENIQVQVLDTPPLSREYIEPRLRDMLRRADVLLLVVDLQQDPVAQMYEGIGLLEEFRIAPLHRQSHYPADPGLRFIPLLVLVNKCDDQPAEEVYQVFCELLEEKWPCLPVSALSGHNLDALRKAIFERLGIIRVYTRAPGKEANFEKPFILKNGSNVEELAGRIHKDFVEKMKHARVWGKGVYSGQMVQRDHILQEGDVVEIQM